MAAAGRSCRSMPLLSAHGTSEVRIPSFDCELDSLKSKRGWCACSASLKLGAGLWREARWGGPQDHQCRVSLPIDEIGKRASPRTFHMSRASYSALSPQRYLWAQCAHARITTGGWGESSLFGETDLRCSIVGAFAHARVRSLHRRVLMPCRTGLFSYRAKWTTSPHACIHTWASNIC